jgi:hypothetical protein
VATVTRHFIPYFIFDFLPIPEVNLKVCSDFISVTTAVKVEEIKEDKISIFGCREW